MMDMIECPPQVLCNEVKAKAVHSDLTPIPLWKGSVKLEKPFIDALVPLVDFELEVDVEANICLPTPAREIKSIRKNVTLNNVGQSFFTITKSCKSIYYWCSS